MNRKELHRLVTDELRAILHHAGADLEIIPEFGDDGVTTYAGELLDRIESAGILFVEELR